MIDLKLTKRQLELIDLALQSYTSQLDKEIEAMKTMPDSVTKILGDAVAEFEQLGLVIENKINPKFDQFDR